MLAARTNAGLQIPVGDRSELRSSVADLRRLAREPGRGLEDCMSVWKIRSTVHLRRHKQVALLRWG